MRALKSHCFTVNLRDINFPWIPSEPFSFSWFIPEILYSFHSVAMIKTESKQPISKKHSHITYEHFQVSCLDFYFIFLVQVSSVACSFGAKCWVWMTQVSLYSVSSCNRMNITVGWTSCGGTNSRGSARRSRLWRTSTGCCWRTFYLLTSPNTSWDATGKMRWIPKKTVLQY